MANKETIDVDDDEGSIDQEQLEEYEELVDDLGPFPDKVKINSLSMVAEDHAESRKSAQAIYDCIRCRLFTVSRDRLLPLVYVLDAILKNAKGFYVDIMEKDAANWIPAVHQRLQEEQRKKLERVWRTWSDPFQIFAVDRWKVMGRCFDEKTSGNAIGSSSANVAGISRTKDGSLLLTNTLRAEMQSILDDLQSNVTNELEKVSLERLADINADLLGNIKQTAEDNIRHRIGSSGNGDATKVDDAVLPNFFTETRLPDVLARSKVWYDFKWDALETSHDVVAKLQQCVRETTAGDATYTQQDAILMTNSLATSLTAAAVLTQALERMKNAKDRQEHKSTLSFPGVDNGRPPGVMHSRAQIDAQDFSNDGIKKKNSAVIGILYEVGLPFVSSADGRRFATQLELSNHLDALFKRNQIEKSMARTDERDWYEAEDIWMGFVAAADVKASTDAAQEAGSGGATGAASSEEYDPMTSTVPADETRDRCVICGINFKMIFDNESGMYRYSNCREIEVLNDDEVAINESELMLCHVTCWQGLGSPDVLTMDQALQDTLPH